jgi:MraZ protein
VDCVPIRVAPVGQNRIYCVHLWGNVGKSGAPGLTGVSLFRRNIEHMFLGQYTHSIDSKGRLTVPVRFRASLASGAFVTQGFERNLMVYTTESFHRLAQRATTLTTTDPEARAVRRVIFGGATEVQLDSAGRILIPPFLREYAQLDAETTIVGAGEYFELWNESGWQDELGDVTDPDINARRFINFDLSSG